LKNKFYEGKKNLKNVAQENEKNTQTKNRRGRNYPS
jgi:hypothetical protein